MVNNEKRQTKRRTISLGDIVETIFLEGLDPLTERAFDTLTSHITDFCVDTEGHVCKSVGFINVGSSTLHNNDYVPRHRFDIRFGPWNAHNYYVEITLPNPAIDYDYYLLIRRAFIDELSSRLTINLRKHSKQR